ncbi:hypothetical protein J2046_006796 [Rhizobium petrolearium]|nr:hypothetical protein [Neorhizobium petrolearium]
MDNFTTAVRRCAVVCTLLKQGILHNAAGATPVRDTR